MIHNTTVIEFLAANQPDLIKQWHSHVGINSLKQLAEEYGEKPAPEPTHEMVELRRVYSFIEWLICDENDYQTFDKSAETALHKTAEFWRDNEREAAKHLAAEWDFIRTDSTIDDFGLTYDFNELLAEHEAELVEWRKGICASIRNDAEVVK